MSEKTFCCCCLNLKQAALVASSWSLVRSFQLLDTLVLPLFQFYSLAQFVFILYQEAKEGLILQTSQTTNHSSTTPAYGSVLQPSGMERDELRVYNSLLVFVFFFVIFTCFLLFIDICKKTIARLTKNITLKMLQSISYLLLPWLFFTIISIILEFFIYIFIVFNKKVGLQFSNTL